MMIIHLGYSCIADLHVGRYIFRTWWRFLPRYLSAYAFFLGHFQVRQSHIKLSRIFQRSILLKNCTIITSIKRSIMIMAIIPGKILPNRMSVSTRHNFHSARFIRGFHLTQASFINFRLVFLRTLVFTLLTFWINFLFLLQSFALPSFNTVARFWFQISSVKA